MKKGIIYSIFLLFSTSILYPQKYGTGLILDQNKFDSSPKAPHLTRGDFNKLPNSFSFKKYAPTPGNQGNSATCSGWAISYSARTILENLNNQDKTNTENTFSPSYVYNQIRSRDGCSNGTSLIDGLNLIKNDGVLPFDDFGYNCERKVKNTDRAKASKYRIKEYRQILNSRSKNKILSIKKSISQSNPVVIGINCPNSFYSVKDVWHPKKEDYKKSTTGHAITIIGYDDNKYEGAFEIINSWGVNWGDSGFAWIKYEDIEHFGVWAGELIGYDNRDSCKIKSDIKLKTIDGNNISLIRRQDQYSTSEPFNSGDMFQLHIKNQNPAYLYIFSSDSVNGKAMIFPNDTLMSEFLAYDENNIILPAEDLAFVLDEVTGISSFTIILSTVKIKDEINIILAEQPNISHSDFKNKLSVNTSIRVDSQSELYKKQNIFVKKASNKDLMFITKIDFEHTRKEK